MRPARTRPAREPERGAGTVLVLLVVAVLGLGLVVGTALASVTLGRHRAQAAADLAALAGAQLQGAGVGGQCRRAAAVAIANGARLLACRAAAGDALLVEVQVRVRVPRLLSGRELTLRARARAGRDPPRNPDEEESVPITAS